MACYRRYGNTEKSLNLLRLYVDNTVAPATLEEEENGTALSEITGRRRPCRTRKDRFQVKYTDIDRLWKDKDL